MNKDIWKYIANCTLCHREKAMVQSYWIQMTEITETHFNKIATDLLTKCITSTLGNKHILTIIDYLTEWPEAFPMPDKSGDTIVLTFINHYLPVHMCPKYILSTTTFQYTCVLNTSYQTKELSLRTSQWIMFSSNLALLISSLHLITLRAMGN